ncbi:hypothetical protein FA15DRAFT_708531 [Coprinopsis marcescibilis]|uniref:Uncharacterized protein n=1 Tax=Coprinopsis marcescibilis TaxID=230819 RepID=A0A5C3KIN0_COPMA|nr:hypothetical protein FA15DRAFT_708531 [Coprinopsis marcescibilis]
MATHHLHQRRQHSNLRKRRQPIEAAGKLHDIVKLDNVEDRRRDVAEQVQQEDAAVLERRQGEFPFPSRFFTIPTTDLFPPEIPGRPRASTSVVDEIEPTTSQFIRTTPIVNRPSVETSAGSAPVIAPAPVISQSLRTTFVAPSPSSSSSSSVRTAALTTSTPEPVPSVTTITSYVRAETAGSAASTAPSVADLSGAISAGPVVGGIIAGIVGIVAITFAVAFFVRRAKRKRDDTFDPSDFRRSAMLMPEPPTHEDTVKRGFNPPSNPPSMVERPLPRAPAEYIPQFVVPLHNDRSYTRPNNGANGYDGAYSDSPSDFSPTRYYTNNGLQGNTMSSQTPSPSYSPGETVDFSALTANPFMNPAPYTQSPFSPITSPVSQQDPFNPQEGDTTVLAQIGGAAVLTRALSSKSTKSTASGKAGKLSISVPGRPSVVVNTTVYGNGPVAYPSLSRQFSSASSQSKHSVKSTTPPVPRYPESSRPSNDRADYADLARTSVSPYQAAQYAEISKRLKVEVPTGMPSPMVEEYLDANRDRDLPPLPPPLPLPFANATPPPPPPAPLAVASKSRPQSPQQAENRLSMDSVNSLIVPPNLDFPIPPPSPAFTTSSRHRIPSTPPCLPEIHVQSRVSVGSYTTDESFNAKLAHHAFGLEHPNGSSGTLNSPGYHGHGQYGHRTEPAFPSGITAGASPFLGKFPVTPSPLATSFSVVSPGGPNAREKRFSSQQERSLINVVAEKNMTKAQPMASALLPSRLGEELPDRTPSMRAAIVAGKRKAPAPPDTPQGKRTTTYSLYDPEDAYGGI